MPCKRNVPKPVAQARARLAGLVARGADPETIAAARAQLAEANAAADVGRWPQLGDQARTRLADLVLSGGGEHAP
jgi:hypothetical protein